MLARVLRLSGKLQDGNASGREEQTEEKERCRGGVSGASAWAGVCVRELWRAER